MFESMTTTQVFLIVIVANQLLMLLILALRQGPKPPKWYIPQTPRGYSDNWMVTYIYKDGSSEKNGFKLIHIPNQHTIKRNYQTGAVITTDTRRFDTELKESILINAGQTVVRFSKVMRAEETHEKHDFVFHPPREYKEHIAMTKFEFEKSKDEGGEKNESEV